MLAAALLAGGCSKEAEQEKARLQSELAQVRSENEELKRKPDPTAELERLRKEHEELLQLRNEVSQMRDQNKKLGSDLQAALAQRGQAQQQQQQSTAELQTLRNQTLQMQTAQTQARISECMNNLRAIQAAKQQWAVDKQKPAISIPTPNDLAGYFPNGVVPVCPDGGTYAINSISVPPTCTVPNHVMPR